MVRRKGTLVAAFFILLASILPIQANARTGEMRIEQVQIEMPEVHAWFHMSGVEAELGELSAALDENRLETVELRRYDPEKDPTAYFFLVDCSTSTTHEQIAAAKTALGQFAQEMEPNATMTLISFGVDVQVLLQRETELDTIMAAVDELKADQPGTVFFDALVKAIELSSGKAYALERKLAFVFSDSVDYNLGGYTRDEVDKLLASSALPFYALGFSSGGKPQLDDFGAVARTSGGDIAVVSADTLPAAMEDMLELTKNAWLAVFDAGTNAANNSVSSFVMELEPAGIEASSQVPVRYSRPDNTPPEVLEVSQHTGKSIRIQFSEPVMGAASTESYIIKNENGDLTGLAAAAYDEESCTATLTFPDAPASGIYIVECPGITDVSIEHNKAAGSVSFAFESEETPPEEQEEEEPPAEQDDGLPIGVWIFLGLAFLAVIIAAVVLSGRKKRSTVSGAATAEKLSFEAEMPSAEQEVQVHFSRSSEPLPKIKLQVAGPSGEGRIVEVPVNKTLFVGRSDICDVYFDDASMSRQHFVIAEENSLFTITNLSQSGGTELNGVGLQNPRPLRDGDTIRAGAQTIVFFTAGQSGEVRDGS